MKALVLALFVMLSGCATCRDHPMACGVAAAVAAGAVVALSSGHRCAAPQPHIRDWATE